jgi:cytochrome c oxidase assembly protein subunit 15
LPDPVSTKPANPVAWWLIATAALTLLMLVIGGITRLTLSGLSITEWKPVEGVLPPLSAADWQDAFDKYRKIPEYAQIHRGMTLDEFKNIFFWEYLHRLVGRVTGIVAIGGFVAALRHLPRHELPAILAVPVLVALQGALGWYMVASGLSVRTSVSQYRLTAHLATALLLYGYCIWIAAGMLRPAATAETAGKGFRRAAVAVLGLVSVTILAGGLTAGTKAGLVFNSFPLMDGQFVPSGYFALSPWFLNPFENVTAVQFDHRLLAETTFLAVLALWLVSWRSALSRPARLAVNTLMAASCIQVALGISTLLLAVPVPLAALHQAGAALVLTAALLTVRFTSSVRAPAVDHTVLTARQSAQIC